MYSFPIWLRKYTFKSIQDHFKPTDEAEDTWLKGKVVEEAKKTIKVPDYVTSITKPKSPLTK